MNSELLAGLEQRTDELLELRSTLIARMRERETQPCDRGEAAIAIDELYRKYGKPTPACIWFDSPDQAFAAIALFFVFRQGGKKRRWDIAAPINLGFLGRRKISTTVYETRSLLDLNRIAPPTRVQPFLMRNGAIESANEKLEYCNRNELRAVWQKVHDRLAAHDSPLLEWWQRNGDRIFNLNATHYEQEVTKQKHIDRSGGCLVIRDGYSLDPLVVPDWITCYPEEKLLHTLGVHTAADFEEFDRAVRECGWWFPMDDACILIDRPTQIHVHPETKRPHHETGKAFQWSNGWGIYALDGIMVTENIINRNYSVADIESTSNLEVRRVMVQRFGMDKYILQSDARVIHMDRFGSLYVKEQPFPDEPLYMVRVRNSTPEPDGTYKDYFIRVPPEMHTAREAVAWTFGLSPHEYDPDLQT